MPLITHQEARLPIVGPGGRVQAGRDDKVSAGEPAAPCQWRCGKSYAEKLFVLVRKAETALSDRFPMIERSGQHYMQCLCDAGGWLLEKREGDEGQHFRALSPVKDLPDTVEKSLMQQIVAQRRQQG